MKGKVGGPPDRESKLLSSTSHDLITPFVLPFDLEVENERIQMKFKCFLKGRVILTHITAKHAVPDNDWVQIVFQEYPPSFVT